MARIVSALVFTIVDILGTPRTESWFTLEFEEAYQQGGISFNLSPYYKFIDQISVGQVSGEAFTAGFNTGTALAQADVTVASGSKAFMQPRVEDYGSPRSCRFEILATNILSGGSILPITSAPVGAISGLRFLAHVIGY